MTCGKGIQTRSVSCVSGQSGQLIESQFCKSSLSPPSERICPENPDCRHQVSHQSSHIEHNEDDQLANSHWKKGSWSEVFRII